MSAKAASVIVVSASMALVATQAMASVGKDSAAVINLVTPHLDPALQARIDAAVAKKDVKQAISSAFSILSTKFGENNESLTRKYFSEDNILVAGLAPGADDFSVGGTVNVPKVVCYSNCHSACHSACHGSRGWR